MLCKEKFIEFEVYKEGKQRLAIFAENGVSLPLLHPLFIYFCDKWKENLRWKVIDRMRRLSYEDVKRYIENDSLSQCKLISKEYKNNRTKLEIKCKCGNKFSVAFDNFKKGKTLCNECSNKIKINGNQKTHKQFILEMKNLVGKEYIILEKYKNAYTKILFNLAGQEVPHPL